MKQADAGLAISELATLQQRILDEQAAFDKMENLFLQGQEGFRVLEFKLVKKDVMLEEQRRLMRISNQKLVDIEFVVAEAGRVYDWQNQKIAELDERLKKYGSHFNGCPMATFTGNKCDCGWDEG